MVHGPAGVTTAPPLAGKRERLRGEQGPRASDLCDRVVDLVLIRRSAAPRRGVQSPPGQELLGAITSLGPSRECYTPSRKSRGAAGGNGRRAGRGARRCLLKGCEQRFRPRQARQRYCSEQCRQAARAWSRWKAQAELSGHGGGQTEAQRAKPALPGARQEPKTSSREKQFQRPRG